MSFWLLVILASFLLLVVLVGVLLVVGLIAAPRGITSGWVVTLARGLFAMCIASVVLIVIATIAGLVTSWA